jgi:hypothetical protein
MKFISQERSCLLRPAFYLMGVNPKARSANSNSAMRKPGTYAEEVSRKSGSRPLPVPTIGSETRKRPIAET